MANKIKLLSNLELEDTVFSGGLLRYDQDYSTEITPQSIPDAAWVTGNTGGGPSGNDTEIQFNSGGTLCATTELTFDPSNNAFTSGFRCGASGWGSTVLGG